MPSLDKSVERIDQNMLARTFGLVVTSSRIANLVAPCPRFSVGNASALRAYRIFSLFARALGQLMASSSNFRWQRVGASLALRANRKNLLASNKAKHCRFARTSLSRRPCSRRYVYSERANYES